MTNRIVSAQPDQHVVCAAIKCTQFSHLIKELPSPRWPQNIPDFPQETTATHAGTRTTEAILLFFLFPQEMV